jgi:outer membrane protein
MEVLLKMFRQIMVATLLLLLPVLASAQGRIAVVDLQAAILQTDYAQERLAQLEDNEDFKADKANFEALRAERDQLVENYQRDEAAMSDDQKAAARQRVSSKQADLEYVAQKLQASQQQNAQQVFQELAQAARAVLGQIIETDQIGLLLQQQNVIHADLGYSITAKVTDKLNQLPRE